MELITLLIIAGIWLLGVTTVVWLALWATVFLGLYAARRGERWGIPVAIAAGGLLFVGWRVRKAALAAQKRHQLQGISYRGA